MWWLTSVILWVPEKLAKPLPVQFRFLNLLPSPVPFRCISLDFVCCGIVKCLSFFSEVHLVLVKSCRVNPRIKRLCSLTLFLTMGDDP
jgi:hypothetical protein